MAGSLKSRYERIIAVCSTYLHVDISYILRGGFWLVCAQLMSALIGFAMSIGYANLITPETLGTYRYIISTYSLIAIIALPGIDTAVLQSVSHGFTGSFREGIRSKFRWGILGSLAAFAVAAYYLVRHTPDIAILFVVAAASLPLMEIGSLSASYFNAKKEYRTWAIFDVATQIVTTIALLVSMWVGKYTLILLLSYFVSNIVMRSMALWYISRHEPAASPTDPDLTRYAKSVSIFQVIARISTTIDNIALFHLLGPAQLAVFTIATAIPSRAQGLLRILGTLAFPKFAKRETHEIAHHLPKKMLMLAGGVMVICLCYAGIAPWFFRHVFPKYIASVPYSQVFIFSTLSAITYPVGSLLFAHKRVKDTYVLSLSSLAIKIASLLIFVPLYGIWGAVISALSGGATTIAYSFFLLFVERKKRPA